MHFDFVDIGTSNFQTSISELNINPDFTILLVEPVSMYLNQFRKHTNQNVYLCECAVSDIRGEDTMYYLTEEFIESNLPEHDYLRGCNSIGAPHSMVIDALTLIDSDISVLQTEKVEKITFDDLCSRYSITSIGKLKIDVERHEHAILPSVLEKIRTGMKINSLFVEHYPNDVNYHLKQDLFSSIEKCGYERIDYDFDVSLIKNETNCSM